MDIFIARRIAILAHANQKLSQASEKADAKETNFNRREQKAFWKESEKAALWMELGGLKVVTTNSDADDGTEGEQEDGGDGDIAGEVGAEEGFIGL